MDPYTLKIQSFSRKRLFELDHTFAFNTGIQIIVFISIGTTILEHCHMKQATGVVIHIVRVAISVPQEDSVVTVKGEHPRNDLFILFSKPELNAGVPGFTNV